MPIRMVVVKLSQASGGGLFVYNPLAATRELLDAVAALERETGEQVLRGEDISKARESDCSIPEENRERLWEDRLLRGPFAPDLPSPRRSVKPPASEVRHIVLGSLAVEHKTYAGPFAQRFPEASVWLQPGQYSVPLNLPPELLGFPARTRLIPPRVAALSRSLTESEGR